MTRKIAIAVAVLALLVSTAYGQVQATQKPHGERFRAADKDGDGKVSLEEYKAAFPNADEERFRQMDKNADGFLSKEDRPEGVPEGGPKPPMEGPRKGHGDRGAKMRAADKDGDGKVSLDEYKAAFPKADEERFRQMDKNADGFLSKEDRPKKAPEATPKCEGSDSKPACEESKCPVE